MQALPAAHAKGLETLTRYQLTRRQGCVAILTLYIAFVSSNLLSMYHICVDEKTGALMGALLAHNIGT
jgi:hypothetical protein